MAQVCGKFKLASSDDHFEEFLKACGVSLMIRKAGMLSKPVVEIKKEDEEDTYTIKTNATFKTTEIKFKLGEEFDEVRLDGSNCKSVVTLDGNKFIQKQMGGDKEVTIIREIDGDQMKTICSVEDITSTRVYNRCD